MPEEEKKETDALILNEAKAALKKIKAVRKAADKILDTFEEVIRELEE